MKARMKMMQILVIVFIVLIGVIVFLGQYSPNRLLEFHDTALSPMIQGEQTVFLQGKAYHRQSMLTQVSVTGTHYDMGMQTVRLSSRYEEQEVRLAQIKVSMFRGETRKAIAISKEMQTEKLLSIKSQAEYLYLMMKAYEAEHDNSTALRYQYDYEKLFNDAEGTETNSE